MNLRLSNRLEGDLSMPEQMGNGAWIVTVNANALAVIALSFTVMILALVLSRRNVNAR